MGTAKNKKAPKQSKPGRPPKKSKALKATPADKQSTKPRPKLKRPQTAHASKPDVDMLPKDVIAATEGLLGLAQGKKGQEMENGLEGYGEVPEVDEEDVDEQNSKEGGVLNPEGTRSSSNSSSEEEDEDNNEGESRHYL